MYEYLLGFIISWGHIVHLPLPLYRSAICSFNSSSSRRALSSAERRASGCFSPAARSIFIILWVAFTKARFPAAAWSDAPYWNSIGLLLPFVLASSITLVFFFSWCRMSLLFSAAFSLMMLSEDYPNMDLSVPWTLPLSLFCRSTRSASAFSPASFCFLLSRISDRRWARERSLALVLEGLTWAPPWPLCAAASCFFSASAILSTPF